MNTTAPRLARRVIAVLGAAALTVGMIGFGTVASGAWFTASSSARASVTGATLSIGQIGASDTTSIGVTGVYPMTDAQTVAGARSEWINIRNTGSIPLDWTLAIVNPKTEAPLTADQLANFRFQLYSEQGAALGQVQTLGSMPAAATPGVYETAGTGLVAGGTTRVEMRVWLSTDSGNEFQGARATFDVVINAIQNGGGSTSITSKLTATRSGSPLGSTTALSWEDVGPQLKAQGISGQSTYTVERSTSRDFSSDVTRVYEGTGLGSTDRSSETPTADGPNASIAKVYLGDPSVGYCVINTNQTLLCRTGTGAFFLSNGNLTGATPVRFDGPKKIVDVALGTAGACALTDAGELWCWTYKLGRGDIDANSISEGGYRAQRVDSGALAGKRIVSVRAEQMSSRGTPSFCAVAFDGTAACWGGGSELDWAWASRGAGSAVPVSINYGSLFGQKVEQIEFTGGSGCARTAYLLSCWGTNGYGTVGIGNSDPDYTTVQPVTAPVPLKPGEKLVDLSGGYSAACVLTSASRLFCWGTQPGIWGPFYKPTEVTPLNFTSMTDVQVVAGGFCVINAGVGSCWGHNDEGSLGVSLAAVQPAANGTLKPNTFTHEPLRLTGSMANRGALSLTASTDGRQSCAMMSGGGVSCWGNWGSDPADNYIITPVPMIDPPQATRCAHGIALSSTACGLSLTETYYYRLSVSVNGVAVGASSVTVSRD